MRFVTRLGLAVALVMCPPALLAQDARPAATDSSQALALFLDCAANGCDFDYLRTELTWVNYVRERTVASVHVIATSLSTGSGGSEVTLKFSGLKEFAGLDDEIRFTNPQGASGDEQRKEFTRVLKIGLARYAVRTAQGKSLSMAFAQLRTSAPSQSTRDPWKAWVFSVGVSGYFSGESHSTSKEFYGNFNASRVTEQWKARASFSGGSNKSTYDLGDGETYEANSHNWNANGLIVRSLGANLSLGATFSGSNSTRDNIDLRTRMAPTIEYDFYKYAEYTRRRLVLAYNVGYNRYDYTDTTVYNKVKENIVDHSISLSYATRQPWGSANLGVSGSNFLNDWKKNRLGIFGGMNIRIVRGLQLSYNASYSRVRDQITLAKAGASDEEILLRLRQLQTGYRYNGNLSLSYTFGSVFNNVVNPRLGGGDCCF